jgi:hypothetical protein
VEVAQQSGLYQLGGGGRQVCEPCVKEVLERMPTMRLSDWVEVSNFHPMDACDVCDFIPEVR